MKQLIDCADQYIRQCRIRDFALLKICLCAVGIIIGLSIPEKKEEVASCSGGFCIRLQLCHAYGRIHKDLYG
jgi:hypothetical protein